MQVQWAAVMNVNRIHSNGNFFQEGGQTTQTKCVGTWHQYHGRMAGWQLRLSFRPGHSFTENVCVLLLGPVTNENTSKPRILRYQWQCTTWLMWFYCSVYYVPAEICVFTAAKIRYQQACKFLPQQISCTRRPVRFHQSIYNVPAGM
jgi:hypothetical protein